MEKSVRRLREKFHGNIPIETAVLLMRKSGNNHVQVTTWIILLKDELNDIDQDDRVRLKKDKVAMNVINKLKKDSEKPKPDLSSDQDIKDLAAKLKCLPLTEKNLKMFNNASENQIPSSERQFACKDCDKMWWRRVPQRKVQGFAQMEVSSPCYLCGVPVLPSRILPPRRNSGPRTRNPHSCFAENCYNRREPYIPGLECVHPRSRTKHNAPKVLYPSTVHVSSGSTVATCLSQGSLTQCDVDDLILDDIQESDEDGSDSNDS
ncbi:hypothetical protein GDO81_009013 [Engystomops pustulosus]|uniref:Repressor of yield of DENV protein n=1 Tax=Engystomops pustulosus TaxID=76066 RepID=A0AAV7BMY0_ENGPU|nr:hypothetical protein GDO81_009013 [Engystomops pustulosus]